MTVTGGAATDYAYDKNNRLLTETRTTGDVIEITHYGYDDNGNQLWKTKETVKPATGQAASYSVYMAGEVLQEEVELYEYDGFNQLTKSIVSNNTTVYCYNGDGLRVTKNVNGEITTHVWDGQNMVMELDGVGNVTATYLRGINLIASDMAGFRKYYVYNGHGDVTSLTDASGNVIKNYDYDAFGVEKNIDPNDNNPFRYCGEYFDKETETYYLRARYYSPSTGRFTTEDSYWRDKDPITGESPLVGQKISVIDVYSINDPESKNKMPSIEAITQSLNLYVYCMNNPIRYIDPSGNAAGDLFKTVDEAALDFANIYNPKSISDNKEYGTCIYKIEKKVYSTEQVYINVPLYAKIPLPLAGIVVRTEIYYSYVEPVIGDNDSVSPPGAPWFKERVAVGHTHAAFDPKYDNENFSPADENYAESIKVPLYVATPGGVLKVYDPSTDKETTISSSINTK